MKFLTMKLNLLNPAGLRSMNRILPAALVALLLVGTVTLFANPIPADRLPAGGWKPGIPGGIPDTSKWRVINVRQSIPGTSLVAKGDGVAEDQHALQAAINYASANPNTILYLPEGVYRLKAGLLAKSPSGLANITFVIRGDGMGKTQIVGDGVSGTLVQFVAYWTGARNIPVTSGAKAGSTKIVLGDWSLTRDFLFSHTPVLVAQVNDTNAYPKIPNYMHNAIAEQIAPAGWNAAEKSISLSRPLRVNYSGGVKVFLNRAIPYRCGIEKLTIRSINHVGGTQHHVAISGGYQCWIKEVESVAASKWNVRLVGCAQTDVTECYIHDSKYGGGDQGYGVGLFSQCTDNYIYNNIARKLRHSYITEYGGVGNVFAYNYSADPKNESGDETDFLMIDACHHGGYPHFNLWEGNIVAKMGPDNVLGGARFNTFFRNHATGGGMPVTKYGMWSVNVERNCLSNNFVANILDTKVVNGPDGYYYTNQVFTPLVKMGYDGSGDGRHDAVQHEVRLTTFWHENWDRFYRGGPAFSDPRSVSPQLPASLYLASKPAFFGDLAWPPIGPDRAPQTGTIPAKMRYDAMISAPPPAPPAAPGGLKVLQ